MALKVTRTDVWAGDLRDVPGGLAEVLEQIAAGGGSMQFLIARRDDKRTGSGKVFVTPVTSQKTKDAAGRGGLQRASNIGTLRVEGADARGLGAKITRAIADAGVNLRGVSAAVIGKNFVAYFGFDSDADADRAAQALKGFNGRSRAGKRSSPRKATAKRTAARRKR
jgi:predicted amino acid-binding ACT domain protein